MKLSSKAQASINKVIEQFKCGDLSPITQVSRIKINADAPSQKWSLSNRVIAFIQSGELDCRGYRQWENVGRNVKKGSKAVYIFRPHTIKKELENDQIETVCLGFSTVAVFPASATEGYQELPEYTPRILPPLAEVARKFGISVNYVPIAPDRLGDYQTNENKIRLGSQDTRIFFHELTHAIHARIEGGLKGGQHTDQETVAEFTTAVLTDFFGYGDNTGNAWNYISHYADDPLIAITKALGTVERVLEVLLN